MQAGSPSILPSRIPRNVIILGLVSLLTDTSSEMLYPVIPLFLTTVLGTPVAIVGIIEGIAESTASLLKVASGFWSDRLGKRKLWVFAGYGISSLTRPLLALAHGWGLVLTARVLDRVGKGLRTAPRDALIADSVAPAIRGRAFGLHRSMDQTGAIIGPLIGLALLEWLHSDYRTLFLVAFVPAVASTLLVLLARESRAAAHRNTQPFEWRVIGRKLRWFLLAIAVFGLGNSSDAFLILRAKQLGFSAAGAVGLFATFNTIYVACAYPAGVLSDRVGRKTIFVAGLGIFTAVYAAFGLIHHAPWMWALFAVYGIYMGLTDGVSRALVVDLVPASARATALGLHSAVLGIVAFPASALAGVLWDRVGPGAPFVFGAAMAAFSALLLLTVPLLPHSEP